MQRTTRPSPARLRSLAVVAISALVALVSALLAYGAVKPVAAASTQVFIDTAPPSVVHRPVYPVSALIQRAELLGRVLTSPMMVERTARIAGVPADQIGATAHTTARVPAAFKEPMSEERANDILDSALPYRIEVEARLPTPVLDIYTHAPSTAAAVRLADAAVAALEQRLRAIADEEGLAESDRVVLRRLGTARGSVVNAGMAAAVAAITLLLVFGLVFAALRRLTREPQAAAARPLPAAHAGDAWPHTTHLTPWMFAVFLAVVWLVPFSDIQLNVPMPIDLTFDRLVLPVVVAAWALALLAGGRAAPRLRVTRIHLAVGAFVVCAFLSVIFNASQLNETLELERAIKQLPLLVSYVCLFVIASSAIRSIEVRAFLSYTLVLAVICAVGVLFEYRFKQNLFYTWSDKLLPSTFQVGTADSAAVDDIGRRVVRGPALVPLETVAMLSMALPIPLVRLTQSDGWRDRLLYGLAACLLFAAAFATFRKSALLAPVSVIATIAYFRRRELLKLAPLALVLVVVIPVLAPGAVGMTTAQFEPSRLGVATVSDRASDYDAVRPDVWSHLLFGRGWGSYDHVAYRVLDSEILHRVIEMGVLGLLAYLFMIGSVLGAARATIAERDRTWAPLALMGAAAAVSFGVASTLFDVMSFPHAVYAFLAMAGLVAAVVSHHKDERSFAVEPPMDAPQAAGPRRTGSLAPVRVSSRSS
jgi:O-antigen ligase